MKSPYVQPGQVHIWVEPEDVPEQFLGAFEETLDTEERRKLTFNGTR